MLAREGEHTLIANLPNRVLQLPASEREQLTKKVPEILFPKIGIEVEGKGNEMMN
jgi:hypothetical protein